MMMNKTLYQIQEEYFEIVGMLEESGGELTPEIEEKLNINRDDLEDKAQNYALVIRQLEGEASVLKAEIDRMSALKKSKDSSIERLKNTIKYAMDMFDVKTIKGNLVNLTLRDNAAAVVISDDAKIPKKFINKKVTETPDKTAIKDYLKAGNKIKGVDLQVSKSVLIK